MYSTHPNPSRPLSDVGWGWYKCYEGGCEICPGKPKPIKTYRDMVDQDGVLFTNVGVCGTCQFLGYDSPVLLKSYSNRLHYNKLNLIMDQDLKPLSIEDVNKIQGSRMPKVISDDPEFLVIKYHDGSVRIELLTIQLVPLHLRNGFEVIIWDSPLNIEHAKNYLKGHMTLEELCDKNILVYSTTVRKNHERQENQE